VQALPNIRLKTAATTERYKPFPSYYVTEKATTSAADKMKDFRLLTENLAEVAVCTKNSKLADAFTLWRVCPAL